MELSALETYVVDSLPFQRLLNVKQLGMAYAVFPGADYSRFSHCIGVCDQMGRWMESLAKAGMSVDEPKKRLYRLAALLHDVGHYPFSHTLEHAVAQHYGDLATQSGVLENLYFDHEDIGERIVNLDEELKDALIEIGLNRETLENIFAHKDITRLSTLLSSDLDADRVDYLRRTAHHTGLPYGLDDIQYLTTEIRLDSEKRPCWTERALHALDHLLIARFFDYQQVVFNKTVAALELALERVVSAMLVYGKLKLDQAGITELLTTNEWNDWDDHRLFEQIKEFRSYCGDAIVTRLCNSLLRRNPPRTVYDRQFIADGTERKRFDAWREAVKSSIRHWSDKFDLDERLFFVWSKAFQWTSYDLDAPVTDADAEIPELIKLPRVLKGTNSNSASIPLVCHPSSLIRSLYLQRAYSLRVYIALEGDAEFLRRKELEDYIGKQVEIMRLDYMKKSSQTTIFDAMIG